MADSIALAPTPLAAEIITTGTEILLGDIVDTNAAWIAQQLRDTGVNLYYKSTVGDNEARLRALLQQAVGRSAIIIVTGGLGPTVDDITRHAIANATDRPLYLHEGALKTLEERFARFGVPMTENNKIQAHIPQGAILIENPVGTAPGFIVEQGQASILAVPGVPREMKKLMEETVLPYIRQRTGNTGLIRRRILRTFGIGESAIDDRLGELMHLSNPTIGTAAHIGQCDVRIAARADNEAAVEAMLDELEAKVRERIGQYIYSTTPGESFATVLVRAWQSRHATVAVLESNTRGQLAGRLAKAVENFNPVAWAGQVNDESLPASLVAQLAGNPRYTEQLAHDCAQSLLGSSGASFALAMLGSAGADEGVYGKAQGETWLALADATGVITSRVAFGGQDEVTLVRLGNQGLSLLRRAIAPP